MTTRLGTLAVYVLIAIVQKRFDLFTDLRTIL